MNTGPTSSKWSNFFFLATLIPATILCFFAVGSLEKEAAFIEKEYRNRLMSEVRAAHASINYLLKQTHNDLYHTFTGTPLNAAEAEKIYRQDARIAAVYMLGPKKKVRYPRPATATGQEKALLEWLPAMVRDEIKLRPYAKNYRRDFDEKDELVFSEFTAENDSGIIPVDRNGRLRLVFWKNLPDGRITGCLLNMDRMKRQFARAIPEPRTESRILTILDGQAVPLHTLEGEERRDWRQVYVSKEITRTLPNWKIAAYILDPFIFTEKAGRLARIRQVMILVLGLMIVFGSFFVIHALLQRVDLAQQKASFAAKVSHELKTPLTSIRLFCEMLLKHDTPPPEKTRKYLGHILFETNRLSKLINNVLDFTALDKKTYRYDRQVTDAVAFLKEVMETQTARLQAEGFTVTADIPDGPLPIDADPAALSQAIVNILSNAEKYAAEEKTIDVTARAGDGRLLIDITDKGIGVPEGMKEKIFEEFYRVDERLSAGQSGTGLGLTIARKIVEDHGGTLTCHPQETGTRFRLDLPLHRSE